VKLVVLEPESAALRAFLRAHVLRMSGALAEAEVPRALRRAGYGAAEHRRATETLARLALVANPTLPPLTQQPRQQRVWSRP